VGPGPVPSQVPSLRPSSSPSKISEESNLRSSNPSTSPSMAFQTVSGTLEFEAAILITVTGPSHIHDKLNFVCGALWNYVDQMMKEQYGSGAVSSLSCGADDSGDKIHFVAVSSTYFPDDSVAPSQSEYESFLNTLLSSDEAMTALPPRIHDGAVSFGQIVDKTHVEMDLTVDPPVLIISIEDSVENEEEAPSSNGPSMSTWTGVLISFVSIMFTNL
jgi:hypothetical protein